MSKRKNPFGESSPLQLKSRVSGKDVDLGVSAGEKMKSVYEKTKAKLFEGARKLMIPKGSWSTDPLSEGGVSDMIPLPGQLRLDSDGKLCPRSAQLPVVVKEGPFAGVKVVEGFFNNNDYSVADANAIKSGQMKIDSLGKLCAGVTAKQPTLVPSAGVLRHQCQACCHFSRLLQGCTFCEKRTCPGCVRHCYQCENVYCQLCSVINYQFTARKLRTDLPRKQHYLCTPQTTSVVCSWNNN